MNARSQASRKKEVRQRTSPDNRAAQVVSVLPSSVGPSPPSPQNQRSGDRAADQEAYPLSRLGVCRPLALPPRALNRGTPFGFGGGRMGRPFSIHLATACNPASPTKSPAVGTPSAAAQRSQTVKLSGNVFSHLPTS